MSDTPSLPAEGPFRLRARLLTPLADGSHRWETDATVTVDGAGIISAVEAGPDVRDTDGRASPAIDLRPWVVMPGLVDLHAHLPQLPNAGLGAGLDLLTWLERLHLPARAPFGRSGRAERLAPAAFRAFAAAGTTTVLALRRRVRGEPGRRVPGRRGARHPRGDRQGDDGSRHVRRAARARIERS